MLKWKLLNRDIFCDVKVGDLVLVSGVSWFSRLIRWFTTGYKEKPTTWTHVAVVYKGGPVRLAILAEAWIFSRLIPLQHYVDGDPIIVQVWRDETLTDQEREIISKYLENHLGKVYGMWFNVMSAVDGLLAKALRRKDVTFFRRNFTNAERDQVCSNYASGAFSEVDRDFGVEARLATPDDIGDYVLYHRWYNPPYGPANLASVEWSLVCSWGQEF